MATTEKYGLFIGEANDPFSPLIQFNANMRSIDSNMWENNQRGVRVVSEIKNGRVHELTTVNGAGNMMRFVATANWESGDSCTVDGNAVTTLLPSGQPLPNGAWVINSNVLCCLVGTVLTVFTYYIGEYAPAGYGLGEKAIPVDSWDIVKNTGFYISSNDAPNVDNSWYGINIKITDTSTLQVAYSLQNINSYWTLLSCERYILNNVPQPWAWRNPPMLAGVEYRTTKYINGKPVYTKNVDLGVLPNKTTMSITLGAQETTNVFKSSAYRTVIDSGYRGEIPYGPTDAHYYVFVYNNQTVVGINNDTTDWSNNTGTLTIEYTKNND